MSIVQCPPMLLILIKALKHRFWFNTELWNLLQTKRLESYSDMKASFAQFFLGRKGTGAPLHFAYAWNFFYMVDGTKKWYFIEPNDFYLAYPRFGSGSTAGAMFGLYPDDFRDDITPALKYCPYYVAELKPGDVLLNPAYWAHAVKNITDKSVGIATRWTAGGKVGNSFKHYEKDYDINRFASLNFMMGLRGLPLLQSTLRDVSPQFDEHTSMREVGASIFMRLQVKNAGGKHHLGDAFFPF